MITDPVRVEGPCPGCAEPAAGWHGDRAACAGCGLSLLLVRRDHVDERAVRPRLDPEQARAVFARVFARDGEPLPGPPPAALELVFAPFFELSGTVAGVAPGGRAVLRWVQSCLPAVEDRDELGLSEIDAPRVDEGEPIAARPGEPLAAGLAALGIPLLPEADRVQAEAVLAEHTRVPADGEDACLIDRRLALLWYPIWRLRYEVGGVPYQATVDGITGTLLSARVPAKQRRRIFFGVFAAACLGFVLGTMLRYPGLGLPTLARTAAGAEPKTLLPALALALTGAGFYVLLLNAAWNSLRYRNELVYHSGLKTRVLINRPAATLLDRVTAAVDTLLDRRRPRRFDR